MHYSPQVALLQCISSVFLAVFFIHHAYRYDGFDSLNFIKAGRGFRSREAFKRLMVYLYITGSPSFAVQGGLYAYIKYKVHFLPLHSAGHGMPVPYYMWPRDLQDWVMPLQYLNACAWMCELIVHLEELCFFLHLIALTPSSKPWFKSVYFKIVMFGSLISAGTLFGLVRGYSQDPLKGEAALYLAGSIFILGSNFVFFRVFWVFPGFLDNLKIAGGSSEVVIRLKSFHELNKIRVASRFSFGIPIFILSVDGLSEQKLLNHSLLWTDLLLMTGLVGFGIQAVCTLLIFMPRNLAKEAGVLRPTVSQTPGYASQSNEFSSPNSTPQKSGFPPVSQRTGGTEHFHPSPAYLHSVPSRPPRPPQSYRKTSLPLPVHATYASAHPTLFKVTPPSRGTSSENNDLVVDLEIGAGTGRPYQFGQNFGSGPGPATFFDLKEGGGGDLELDEKREYDQSLFGAPRPAPGVGARRPSDPGYMGGDVEGGGGESQWRRRPSIPYQIRNFKSPIDIA